VTGLGSRLAADICILSGEVGKAKGKKALRLLGNFQDCQTSLDFFVIFTHMSDGSS